MDSMEKPAVSSTALTPTDFYSQNLRGFIFLVLETWTMLSGLGLGSLTPQVTLLVFIYHMWKWDHPFHLCCRLLCLTTSPILHLCPLTYLDGYGYFKSLVVGLPYSSIFWQFWVLFVLRFSCNYLCGCTRRESMSTYASILTGSCTHIFNLKLCQKETQGRMSLK